ncbi:MAG: agmatinase [Candidatus Hadarchaeum sp.]|uniref:agmatinase n=1 Tax=Candidatus Hadarchaeum sp. TaxID=2883567 RepID=UPI003D138EC9
MSFEDLVPVRPGFGGFDFPYEKSQIVFFGAPVDITSSYRPGYRFAPARIREASANLETYIMSAGVDVFEKINITDLGDIIVSPANLAQTGERITNTVKRILIDGKIPAIMGGEHTISYFSLQAFADVVVIHLDAHRDLREDYLGDRICHATVMRRVLDRLPADRLIQIGVRSCSKEEAEFAKEAGILAYSAEETIEDRRKIISEVKEIVKNSKIYLSIDLDVLDPAFAPGVSTPEPGGLSTVELLKILKELGKLNISGFDIVELVPPHDDGTTSFVAARIIYELLAALGSKNEDH